MTEQKTLCVGSYNITATFYCDPKDEKDPKGSMPHIWAKRRKYFKQALMETNCDVMGLQELTPEQTLDFLEMFPTHKFYIFTQAQTEEVEAGKIYSTVDEIKTNLLDKFIGTPLIAIMYNPKVVTPKETGIFWYNPEPFKKPTLTDRSLTDKGFGNMNTARGPGYVRFTHIPSSKDFYFFTSHAPISGGIKTRIECFKLENKVIKQIARDLPFFSIGDRNLFDNDVETYNSLVNREVHDWINIENHKGFKNVTWLGYLYEPTHYQNTIQKDGSFRVPEKLDIGISSLKSVQSAHYHCIIRDDRVELLGKLTEADNLTRNFLSDHAMIVAQFNL